ncbi:hypothetical protein [Nitratiruptor sp. SB155-2]|uniref:hypothetical protein n=1 Tax=Nitratiruptor sp. (strain SB155-2) TaxID=387092 RepID=UPI0001586DBC|nr:hypothetical protein [Nitratiruptor sp. SB155-2]BAF69719.1 hypothetical protein NIS_0605 [Nitratiruptor sp. SB155-2]
MEKVYNNEHIKIAVHHLDLASQEVAECSNSVLQTLQQLQRQIQDPVLHEKINEAIAVLQLEDIIVQRLKKVSDFLTMIDDNIELEKDKKFLDEFAWENEVNQDDIDKMFNEYKG